MSTRVAAVAALTRGMHWVSNSANVPRLGLNPSLLLDLAKPQVLAPSDTQRKPLSTVGWQRFVASIFYLLLHVFQCADIPYQVKSVRQ